MKWTFKSLKDYLKKIKELEDQILELEEKIKKLEEEKKKLEILIADLEFRSKQIDSEISTLKYKIRENENYMRKFNPNYIRKLALITWSLTAGTLFGSILFLRGLASLVNLGAYTSSLCVSTIASYLVYALYTSTYNHKLLENQRFSKKIKELELEQKDITKELNISREKLLEVGNELDLSKSKMSSLEKELSLVVTDWNKNQGKAIANIKGKKIISSNSKELKEVELTEAKVLKLLPKSEREKLEKAKKVA